MHCGCKNIGCLISAVLYSGSLDTSTRDDFIGIRRSLDNLLFFFTLFKLVIKPVALLVKISQRSKASCKRNVKATILSIELVY